MQTQAQAALKQHVKYTLSKAETHLIVQCPWGFRGRNVIELSDVFICVSPRPEADWEEGPAKRRAYATKRAQLSAAEASRQLTGASSGQKSGYGWSFLTWSGSILLNKLQFRMKRTHICFKVSLLAVAACGF